MKRQDLSDVKVAWMIPSMARGFAWQSLLEEFANIFTDSKVFTGLWPMNRPKDDVDFNLNVIGKTRFITLGQKNSKYARGIIMPPLGIPFHILKYFPNVILTYGFSIWTVMVLLLKTFTRWRVITVYEGSSPTVDAKGSRLRIWGRKLMARLSDAFITNSHSGQSYLVEYLKARKDLVFVRPYLVPDTKILCEKEIDVKNMLRDVKRPVFMYVGLLIQRKGIEFLIESLASLKEMGYDDFTLVIAGDGSQREKLEAIVKDMGIESRVRWLGWVDYGSLGYYFDSSDIFVFPTYEDTWGLVVLEAMAFGKPVICSQLAGAVEMVKDGENGFTFNPARDKPEALSELLRKFIDDPGLARRMGQRSKKMASLHTPESVANHIKYIVEFALGWRDRASMKIIEHPQEQN